MKSPATNVVRLIGILIIFLMLADSGFAQRKRRSGRWKLYRKEVNGGFGVNTFLSGLGEHNLGPIRGASVRPTFNVSFRYWLKERIVLRASLTYG
ncbi:MAG: hypothetical protein AAGB22_09655, partial [Bacteroidota bacterium]